MRTLILLHLHTGMFLGVQLCFAAVVLLQGLTVTRLCRHRPQMLACHKS
jgi:hypothetical protein